MSDNALRRLAASVLCVGFEGATPEQAPLEALADLAPGGIILFARNTDTIESTRALVDAAREAIGGEHPPFVAVDQEGGRVARLRKGAADMPAMMAVGACSAPALAARVGGAHADDLRAAGCTVNFAPVADLALASASTVIGSRAFGDEPERVGELIAAYVQGLQAGGVTATLKHFPGHGATETDSHVALPVVHASREILRTRDLVPFTRGIAVGAGAVMVGHLLVPALDAEHPATMSRVILTDLLRGELGFTGVCFTDCMEMDAVAAGVGTVRGAVAALAAGADSIVVSHHLELARAARDAIVEAVRSGSLPRARLEEAVGRVALLRTRPAGGVSPILSSTGAGSLTLMSVGEGSPALASAGTGSPTLPPAGNSHMVAREVARNAVTVVRGNLCLDAEKPVTIVSFEGTTVEGAQGRHVDHASLNMALRTRRFRSEMYRVPLEPETEMLEHLVALVRAQAGRQFVFLSRRAYHYPAQRKTLEALFVAAPEALLVAVREPFDVPFFPQARKVACTYDDGEQSLDALADVLSGRLCANGVMPVHIG